MKQSAMKLVADADSCRESSHGVLPLPLGCSFHAKDAPKFSAGRPGALRWSLRDLLLSIEMNTKTPLSPKNMIEFREVSFHINDILNRLIVSAISLEIPQGKTLVLLGRSGTGETTVLKLMNGMRLPTK